VRGRRIAISFGLRGFSRDNPSGIASSYRINS
jgi:hypothetical protein